MGLISKSVKIKWTNATKKHYENLGYLYTYDKDEFEVKVEDLPLNSHVEVDCVCDGCGKELKPTYRDYNKNKKDNNIYCRKCSNKIFGVNKLLKTMLKQSFAEKLIEEYGKNALELYWDYEKNTIDPWKISYKSNKKVWIKCQEKDYHGSYEITCANFINGNRCPYCIRHSGKVHPLDSLGQYIIDNYDEEFLWKIWSDKNEKSPFEYTIKSGLKVWWRCLDNKHKDYYRIISNSVKYFFRCPECIEELNSSIIECKTKEYLEILGYKVYTEHDCTIRPNNPKNNHPLPFDNEIVLKNGKHLIIEVHGGQHYKVDGLYSKTEEELHYRQVLDRYKRIKCIQAGYKYLEIPYTAFDKKETYKKLIDNKIKEILDELD